jgi:hypothetical protein
MAKIMPIYVGESNAAKILDMSKPQFRSLVDAGSLPPPFTIHDVQRWRVADLDKIICGQSINNEEDFQW